MKCKLLRDDLEVSQADPRQMEGQTTVKRVKRNNRMVDRLFWKAGAVLSHPQAFRMVQHGVAVPHDEECRLAANMTTEGMAAAKHAYERLSAGIHPEDFAAYDAGFLSGYNPDGSWKPGLKGGRAEYLQAFGLDDDEDDDD